MATPVRSMLRICLLGIGVFSAFTPSMGWASDRPADAPSTPDPVRAQALVSLVRQDCGSCHGMRLTGGLGPALTREALADKPLASLVATIYHGRPGTPMPPWRALISEAEAHWIAVRLRDGFADQHWRVAR